MSDTSALASSELPLMSVTPRENGRSGDSDYLNNRIGDELSVRAAKGATATLLSRIALLAIQSIGTVVMARLLAPQDFGLVAMALVIMGIVVEFGTLRLSDAVIQKETVTSGEVNAL